MIFDFGYRLKELRKSKKLTQAQVANHLNLSKATISGYENNIKTPSVEVLIQLSLLYGVSTDYLLGLEIRRALFIEALTAEQQALLISLVKEFESQNKKIKKPEKRHG